MMTITIYREYLSSAVAKWSSRARLCAHLVATPSPRYYKQLIGAKTLHRSAIQTIPSIVATLYSTITCPAHSPESSSLHTITYSPKNAGQNSTPRELPEVN